MQHRNRKTLNIIDNHVKNAQIAVAELGLYSVIYRRICHGAPPPLTYHHMQPCGAFAVAYFLTSIPMHRLMIATLSALPPYPHREFYIARTSDYESRERK